MKILLTIYFIISCIVVAQIKIGSDIKINMDNNPSTIIQKEPKIFCNDTSGFIVAWKDYSQGEVVVYAQRFNASGTKVGDYYKIDSDRSIIFHKDDLYTVFYEQYYSYYFMGDYYNLSGKIYDNENPQTDLFQIVTSYLGCDVFCTGRDFEVITIHDTSRVFFTNEGYVSLMKYDLKGNVQYIDSFNRFPFQTSRISSSKNRNNNYVLMGFNNYKYPLNGGDQIPLGIYATFYNENDSVIVKNVLVDSFFVDEDFYYPENVFIKTVCVNDSLFELFWINSDSLTFNYVVFNERGTQLTSINSLKLPFNILPLNWTREFYNFTFSPFNDGSFAVFISSREFYYENPEKYYNSLFYFNSMGELLNSYSNQTYYPRLGKQIFKSGTNEFFTTVSDGKDVFLMRINNLSFQDSIKLNNDLTGSNESNPQISKIDNQTNFVTWNDENSFKGREVNINGIPKGNPITLKGQPIIFTSNGRKLNVWNRNIKENYYAVGYDVYDATWNLISEDTLLTSTESYSLGGNVMPLNNDLSVLYFYNNNYPNNRLYLRTINSGFEKVNEINFPFQPFGIQVIKKDSSSFWLSLGSNLKLFSSELDSIGETQSQFFGNLYLGNSKFLFVSYDYSYPVYPYRRLYGTIFTTSKDTLVKQFYVASNVLEYKLLLLPNKDFLVTYIQKNKIYARAFSAEGEAKTDSFLVSDNVNSFKKNPGVNFNNNQLNFVWADARNSGMGYDIYTSIYDYSSVVNVQQKENSKPMQYSLEQNYPNPFNPVTTIRFIIPEAGLVTIKVYDILGKELATLLNENKFAGEYRIDFYGGNLASGIYYYQLRCGSFVDTKKFILMK